MTSIPEFILRFQRRSSTSTPATIFGLSSAEASSKRRELAQPLVGAVPDDEGKRGEALIAQQVDDRAVGRDRADLAVLLPKRDGRALDDVDDDPIGIEFAHARLLDQRQRLEILARLRDVEERQRILRS